MHARVACKTAVMTVVLMDRLQLPVVAGVIAAAAWLAVSRMQHTAMQSHDTMGCARTRMRLSLTAGPWHLHIAHRACPHGASQRKSWTRCDVTARRHALLGLTSLLPLALSGAPPARAALVDEDVALRIYAACQGSVVTVINSRRDRTGTEVPTGVGSGFVWDARPDGPAYIVTNYHVVSKLDKSTDVVKVVLPDQGSGRTSVAQLVASDTAGDIAVLSVTDGPVYGALTPAPIGTSGDLKIGQAVYALGAPYGLSSTLTAGVVSGLDRSIPSPVGTRIYGVIQTDASINAGNSGGPLLDSAGRVVGVNTATFTRSGTGRGSGINFALPIDRIRDTVPKLIVYGNASGRRL